MKVAIVFPGLKGTPQNQRSIGDIYQGETPLDVITAMQYDSMFTRGLTLEEYVDTVKKNCSRLFNIHLEPKGKGAHQLAKSLLTEMRKAGLAVIIDPKK